MLNLKRQKKLLVKENNCNESTWVFPYPLELYILYYILLFVINLSKILLTKSVFNEDFKLLPHVGSSLLSWTLYPVYNLLLDGVDYKQ